MGWLVINNTPSTRQKRPLDEEPSLYTEFGRRKLSQENNCDSKCVQYVRSVDTQLEGDSDGQARAVSLM